MNATVETQSKKAAAKTLHFNTIKEMVRFFLPASDCPGIPASQIAECISYPDAPTPRLKHSVYNVLTELTKGKLVLRDEMASPSTYTATLSSLKVRSLRASLISESKGSAWKVALPPNAIEELLGTFYTLPGSMEVKQSVARRIMSKALTTPTLAEAEPLSDLIPLQPTLGAKKGAENLSKVWTDLDTITRNAVQSHTNNVVKLIQDKSVAATPVWVGPNPNDLPGDEELVLNLVVEGRLKRNQLKALYLELKDIFE